jgi:hypothetical protein
MGASAFVACRFGATAFAWLAGPKLTRWVGVSEGW